LLETFPTATDSSLKVRIGEAKLKTYNMEEYKDTTNLGENVVKVLKTIYDPEIPVDIYELGLIYDVMINEDNEVRILMTLTSPNCPVAESLPLEVEEKVASIDEIVSCNVEITFDPPWSKDLMSEEAKLELGML
jgi:FeS assembly SUF system protein